jgi:hypothetical protein
MTWMLLLAFLIAVGVISLSSQRQVPWASRLRRINAGAASRAEWMAPQSTVDAVRSDYMRAMHWLPDSMLQAWTEQWATAPYYLSGAFLRRHQEILKYHRTTYPPRYIGVLQCEHQPHVRHFSDDGERCLVIDHQSDQRMITYDYWTQKPINTQNLGPATLVYEMFYDRQQSRWKIDRYVQELPLGWHAQGQSTSRLRLFPGLLPIAGRDQ